jgi:VanZ family protein
VVSERWRSTVKGRRGRTALALGYATGVLVASLLPAPGSGLGASGPLGLVAVDLWLHTVGYAVLATLVAVAIGTRERRALAAVVLAVVLYGLLIEVLQSLSPTRAASLLDAVANAVGAIVGAGVRSTIGR